MRLNGAAVARTKRWLILLKLIKSIRNKPFGSKILIEYVSARLRLTTKNAKLDKEIAQH